MAYIDVTKIQDIFAKKIIDKDPAKSTEALEMATLKTNDLCNRRQVYIADIPLDETTQNIVSPTLYLYCYHYYLHYLYKSVQGAVSEEDIYTRESMKEEQRALAIEPEISKSVIMQKEVIDNAKRGGGIPIL